MSDIRLSFCIPTYNFGRFIGETLKSVIDQATDEVEIVVLDSGSTDNTADVVRGFQSHFSRLAYHRREQKGGIDRDLAATVDLARGEYCWLLSSDDVLMPGAVRRILREIEAGHAVYLCNRTECDQSLHPLRTSPWLTGDAGDRTFTLKNPGDLIDYFNRSRSIGALFSYISSIVVKRELWSAASADDRVIGSNYAHAARLFSTLLNGGALRYIRESLILCRGDNDSFSKDGIVKRFLIDLDGYLLLADALFSDAGVRHAFLAVMRREHPWYVYAELRSRIGHRDDWSEFRQKLLAFGYVPWQTAIVGAVGSLPPVMSMLRLLWFGARRVRDALARSVGT